MASIKPPPIEHAIIDKQQVATMPWVLFFDSIYRGDAGQDQPR
jgi:hypothetical protein